MFENILFLGNSLDKWIFSILLIGLGIAASQLVALIFKKIIKPMTEQTETDIDDIIAKIIELPISYFCIAASIYLAHDILTLSDSITKVFDKGFGITVLIMITFVAVQVVDLIVYKILTHFTQKTESEWDDHLVPIVRQVIKIILILMSILMIIDNSGFDITSILAGLGIGGLAFAFAAQDIIKNLFGGISVFMDKPFKPGDYIKVAGVEGTVEIVGLRTTKIRTLDDRVLTLPNAKLTENVVENVSIEGAKRVITNLGLTYDTTTKKIEEAVNILKDIAKKSKNIRDDITVSFNKFEDSALNIMLIYWVTDKTKFWETQHEINMEIKRRFENAKIEFAFPTRTLQIIKSKK